MIAGVADALVVGLALGLLGSGGSILTVPVLIYGLGIPAKTAIASSLVIVGGIALFGTALQARRGNVATQYLIAFGVPGLLGAAAGGTLAGLVPAAAQMTVFAAVLLGAAGSMLRPQPAPATAGVPRIKLVSAGTGVGLITGLIGVGGGFLLVPALRRFGRLSLPAATGTSLALLALNAFAGLAGQQISGAGTDLPALLIAVFIVAGILGLVGGDLWRARLPVATLQHMFVVVLFSIAAYTLLDVFALG